MGSGDETTDSSDLRLRDVPIAILVAVLWLGIPAVLLTGLWLAVFIFVEAVTRIDIPPVTVGLVAATGAPPTVAGVSTLVAVVAGLATWVVWFVRYGRHGGSSDPTDKFQDRMRDERRWEF